MRQTMMVLSVVLALAAACDAADTRDIQPIAVWSPTPTQPAGQATLNHLIDGDWEHRLLLP